MESNRAEAYGQAILDGHPEILPFFLEKGSVGEAVRSRLHWVFEASGYHCLLIEVDDPGEAVERMRSPDLVTHLYPFSQWENQRAWYVRFCDAGGDIFDDGKGVLEPVNVLLDKLPAGGLQRAEPGQGILFALDPSLSEAPSKPQLAEVLAHYLFSGWLSYWRSRLADLHHAFAITEPGRLYYLGLSWLGPDWQSVVEHSKMAVMQEMRDRWLQSTHLETEVPYPGFKKLVTAAVPEYGYLVTEGDTNEPHVILANGQEELGIKMTERLRKSKQLSWERRLGELLETGHTVAMFLTTNAKRWAVSVVRKRFEASLAASDDYLNPFHAEHRDQACLTAISKRIQSAKIAIEKLDNMYVKDRYKIKSLAENIDTLKSRILGRPCLKSVLLRLILIAVGCAWLFIGGMVWSDGLFTEADYATRVKAGWGIGGAYLLLVVILLGRWVCYNFGILRAEDLCLRDIRATAAQELATEIAKVSKNEAGTAVRGLNVHAENLLKLKDDLCGSWIQLQVTDAEAKDPRFPVVELQEFFKSQFESSVRETLDDFMERMGEQDFSMDSSDWMEQAEKATFETLMRIARRISFEDVADACGLSVNERENMIKQSVGNARRILITDAPHNRIPALILLSPEWEEHLGDRDTTRLRHDPVTRNSMVAVCAMPADFMGGLANHD